MRLLICADPNAQNSKEKLEYAKGDTDGQCLKYRGLKETRFDRLYTFLNKLVLHFFSWICFVISYQ